MRRRIALLLLAASAPALAQSADRPTPGWVRVRIATTAGPITVALDARHAPRTTANFLAYVDDGRLDGTSFFRASRTRGAAAKGFIEGGIGSDYRRSLDPVVLEPTSRTKLHNADATISMARNEQPNSATGNFSLLVGASPNMDAKPGKPGYAAFGKVVAGMDVVRRILAQPTGGGSGAMAGQMLVRPVRILWAKRIDGAPHPTGKPKPWLIGLPR